ncbi:MAG: rhodanese-like domain-containing protein [Sulfuricurvum sp.]|jgi:thiosulfate/3-mercaptopyruvate sulfurtransferase|uniref:sulfurtransferase n=1 Tax=Sulfuricurvum sp. TaxID=2025608 RepID=UPI0025F8BCD8|nr:rhodanese-like domain-containing protein [Sulfuricurvum sp.]MCK9372344.1 rhodanese-like domain-containing protein [Sulfuricurvum sp.]
MKIFVALFSTVLSLMAIEPLVSPQWLNEHQNDAQIRIVEVSDGDTYQLEHIGNAVHTAIGSWRFDNGTFLSIRPVEEIEREISRLGIDEKIDVVLYAPINNPKDLLKASYIYWALHYHGVKNVALLDGGMGGWKSAHLPLSNDNVMIKPTVFKAVLDKTKIADMNYVKNHLGKLPMIDARPSDMYLGVTPTPTVKRNGHIKGGMSYSWNYSVDKEYLLKSKNMLESVFKEGYKLDKNKEVLVYCTGGLETSFNYFVLNGVLGYQHVRLYDASMKEWGNRDDTPMIQYRYELFQK